MKKSNISKTVLADFNDILHYDILVLQSLPAVKKII